MKPEHLEEVLAYLSARDRELIDAVKLTAAVREGRAPNGVLDEAEKAILDALHEQRGAAGLLRAIRQTLKS